MFFKPKVCQTFGALQPLNVLQKIENNPVQGWTITQGPPLKTYVYLNKWTDGKNIKQRWTSVSAHEHPWTPMTTHDHPWPPMNLNVFRFVFIDFFQNNAVCKLYVQPLFSKWLIYHPGCLVLNVFKSKYVVETNWKIMICVFLSCAGLAPRKNYPLRLLQHIFIYRYKYIDLYINK